MEKLQEILDRLAALDARANELQEKAQAAHTEGNADEFASIKAMLENEVMPEVERLQADRVEAQREADMKAMAAKVTTLDKVIEELRKPQAGTFAIGGKAADENAAEDPYAKGEASFYGDIRQARMGRDAAHQRLLAASGAEGKAMSEGVDAQGGYLVNPVVERQIVETREQDNVMRDLCSKLNIQTNEISVSMITLGTTAGWVAELAEKPEATSMSLASIAASVFTAAGLATISNQLLADANPDIDRLVTADLAKRLVALEETAFLDGTGTGQPLGLLRTPGVQTSTVATTDVAALIAAILDSVMKVQTEHGNPTAIVMHPRTWTRIIMSQDAQGLYFIGGGTLTDGPAFSNRSLLGYRVVLSNRIPTNLGTGANESRVIVGDFSEALILDRQGITIDESPHVYFTSNQTVFRAEQRVGFTAARAPKAFSIVGGAGLAAG